jgi:hypothetical protein
MSSWPQNPAIHEINTWVRHSAIGAKIGRVGSRPGPLAVERSPGKRMAATRLPVGCRL